MARRGGATFECPNCGAQVRQGARSCPECGADEETGWSEDTMYDGLDLPEPGYGKEETAAGQDRVGRTVGLFGIVTIVVLILTVAIAVFVWAGI